MHSVAVELSNEAHRLRPELRDPSDAAAKRHRPHVAAAGFPVGGDDGRRRDEPAFLQVVVDETLRQELIHIGTAARTCHRPDIVCQYSQRPVARLRQDNGGWPYPQLPLSQKRICCCGQLEGRSNSPDQLSRLLGCNEKCRLPISETVLSRFGSSRCVRHWLVDDRRNPAEEQVPVFRDSNWYHGLNIQHVLISVAGIRSKIGVVLQRDADEAGYWILRRLL